MPIRTMDEKPKRAAVTNDAAYSHMHRREICAGGADGTHVLARSNSRPLDQFIEKDSVRSLTEYNWQTGQYEQKPMDVISNAHRNINRLEIHPVTNARHYGDDKRNEYAVPLPAVGMASNSGKTTRIKKSKSRKGK